MTEWEQLKKEYREIPIPADGPHQVLQAMADAKKKRNGFRHMAKYGTVAAAAVLAMILIPGMMLFSGGFSTAEDNASMEADFAVESTGSAGWIVKESAADKASATNNSAVPEQSYDTMADAGGSGIVTEAVPNYSMSGNGDNSPEVTENRKEAEVPWMQAKEAISKEILRQMEERMQSAGETYYSMQEKYSNGFELLDEEQTYYFNQDGLLVIVFEAGAVAPKEQGTVEFIIPAEVFSLTE